MLISTFKNTEKCRYSLFQYSTNLTFLNLIMIPELKKIKTKIIRHFNILSKTLCKKTFERLFNCTRMLTSVQYLSPTCAFRLQHIHIHVYIYITLTDFGIPSQEVVYLRSSTFPNVDCVFAEILTRPTRGSAFCYYYIVVYSYIYVFPLLYVIPLYVLYVVSI